MAASGSSSQSARPLLQFQTHLCSCLLCGSCNTYSLPPQLLSRLDLWPPKVHILMRFGWCVCIHTSLIHKA